MPRVRVYEGGASVPMTEAQRIKVRARNQMAKAERKVEELIGEITHMARRLHVWQRRERHYSRILAKSDQEIETQIQQRRDRRTEKKLTTRTRKIQL